MTHLLASYIVGIVLVLLVLIPNVLCYDQRNIYQIHKDNYMISANTSNSTGPVPVQSCQIIPFNVSTQDRFEMFVTTIQVNTTLQNKIFNGNNVDIFIRTTYSDVLSQYEIYWSDICIQDNNTYTSHDSISQTIGPCIYQTSIVPTVPGQHTFSINVFYNNTYYDIFTMNYTLGCHFYQANVNETCQTYLLQYRPYWIFIPFGFIGVCICVSLIVCMWAISRRKSIRFNPTVSHISTYVDIDYKLRTTTVSDIRPDTSFNLYDRVSSSPNNKMPFANNSSVNTSSETISSNNSQDYTRLNDDFTARPSSFPTQKSSYIQLSQNVGEPAMMV